MTTNTIKNSLTQIKRNITQIQNEFIQPYLSIKQRQQSLKQNLTKTIKHNIGFDLKFNLKKEQSR